MTKNKSLIQKKILKKNNSFTTTKKKKSLPINKEAIGIVSNVSQKDIFGLPVAKEIKNIITIPLDPAVETIQPEKKIRPRDKVHYVNSKEFEDEIRNYYKSDHITIKLGESLNKIANGLSYAPNFMNYSFKDEMVGDAIVKMFAALKNKKFKIDCGFSPFSYFTTIAFHAFINRIKKEKKHHEAINEYRDKIYSELMIEASEAGGGHVYIEPTGDDEQEE